MSSTGIVVLIIFWFVGLTIGWFFRNGISLIGIAVLIFLSPAIMIVSDMNWWPFTLSFVLGLLIHTWKPLYLKVKQL